MIKTTDLLILVNKNIYKPPHEREDYNTKEGNMAKKTTKTAPKKMGFFASLFAKVDKNMVKKSKEKRCSCCDK